MHEGNVKTYQAAPSFAFLTPFSSLLCVICYAWVLHSRRNGRVCGDELLDRARWLAGKIKLFLGRKPSEHSSFDEVQKWRAVFASYHCAWGCERVVGSFLLVSISLSLAIFAFWRMVNWALEKLRRVFLQYLDCDIGLIVIKADRLLAAIVQDWRIGSSSWCRQSGKQLLLYEPGWLDRLLGWCFGLHHPGTYHRIEELGKARLHGLGALGGRFATVRRRHCSGLDAERRKCELPRLGPVQDWAVNAPKR